MRGACPARGIQPACCPDARTSPARRRYERWWRSAIAARPDAVSITSYNEWGEGTQIEPARRSSTHAYQDYGVPHLYMRLTEKLAAEYVRRHGGGGGGGAKDEL